MTASTIKAHPAAFGFGPAVNGGKTLWKTGIDQYIAGSHDLGHLIPRTTTRVPAQKAEITAALDDFI
jgi:hypothetical protein